MGKHRRPIGRARSLRQRAVPAEALLWKALRNRALVGFKFRRQHPIGVFIADFACVSCKIAIQVDGATHLASRRSDTKRTTFLESEGWCVMRFWNTEIYEELEAACEAVYRLCMERSAQSCPPHPQPLSPAHKSLHGPSDCRAGERGAGPAQEKKTQ